MDARDEVREFARKTGIPYTQTLMGLGVLPTHADQSLGMLGMHGTVYANYSVDQADLLIALGVRFDDRVTGKLDAFATRSRIVHIDVDPAEIHKNKHAHVPVCADVKESLQIINRLLDSEPHLPEQFNAWRQEVRNDT
jgi:acetolactate synthase-1/2/3 large subunit